MTISLVAACGCPFGDAGSTTNPFLTLTESDLLEGASSSSSSADSGGGGSSVDVAFRRTSTLLFANQSSYADLRFYFVAWVEPNSINSTEQEDELIASGYVRLDEEIRLGSVFVLAEGTFVYGGPGVAGATRIFLKNSTDNGNQIAGMLYRFVTPDAILVFADPPVSCDTVAFEYLVDGEVLTSEPLPGAGGEGVYQGANTGGGFKTFSQIDVYQCDPFKPGLFLNRFGGNRQANEFFEGEQITFVFNTTLLDDTHFAQVTYTDPS